MVSWEGQIGEEGETYVVESIEDDDSNCSNCSRLVVYTRQDGLLVEKGKG